MSGRLPLHVNQNNNCNDALSTSGIDLRMTILPQKFKAAGYTTAMVRYGRDFCALFCALFVHFVVHFVVHCFVHFVVHCFVHFVVHYLWMFVDVCAF